jgi:hypothetical protein
MNLSKQEMETLSRAPISCSNGRIVSPKKCFCPRVAQRDKLKQRCVQKTTIDLASEQKPRKALIIEP